MTTETELRAAYNRSNLRRYGIPFGKAMQTPLIRQALELDVKAQHTIAARQGKPLPDQLALI